MRIEETTYDDLTLVFTGEPIEEGEIDEEAFAELEELQNEL